MSESDTVICQNCGAELRAGARFCPRCGRSLPQPGEASSDNTTPSGPDPAPTPAPDSSSNQTTAREVLLKSRPPQQYQPQSQPHPIERTRQSATSPTVIPKYSQEGESASAVSLVCGIISAVAPLELTGGILGNIVGIVLGIIAVYQSSRAKQLGVHNGVQMAGLAMGVIGIITCTIGLLAFALLASYVSNGIGAITSLLQSGGSYYY